MKQRIWRRTAFFLAFTIFLIGMTSHLLPITENTAIAIEQPADQNEHPDEECEIPVPVRKVQKKTIKPDPEPDQNRKTQKETTPAAPKETVTASPEPTGEMVSDDFIAETVPSKPEEVKPMLSMEEEPAAPIPESAEEPGRYDALILSEEEQDLLARLVYLEARGESFEGQVAVAEVVLNRILSDRFPNTMEDVLYQTGQFTPAEYLTSTKAGEEQHQAVAEALDSAEYVLADNVVYFSGAPCNDRVYAVIGGHWFCEI